MAPKELNFITGNKNKLREVQEILSVTPVKLQSQNLDVPELQGSIEEISRSKCRAAADIVNITYHTFQSSMSYIWLTCTLVVNRLKVLYLWKIHVYALTLLANYLVLMCMFVYLIHSSKRSRSLHI